MCQGQKRTNGRRISFPDRFSVHLDFLFIRRQLKVCVCVWGGGDDYIMMLVIILIINTRGFTSYLLMDSK